MGVDPLAMKFANWSTYNYTMSNPDYVTQSISNGSMNPMDHNVFEYGISAVIGKASIENQCYIGGSGGLFNFTQIKESLNIY